MEFEDGRGKPQFDDDLVESSKWPLPVVALREPVHRISSDASSELGLLKELGAKLTEESLILMPKLFSFLKHDDPVVVRQSIACGTSLFCSVLEEMTFQLHKTGKVEGWLEEMWGWMVQFKAAVSGIVFEPHSIGTKVLAAKFLEICVMLFTSNANNDEEPFIEGHPILDPALLAVEANRTLGLILEVLQLAKTLRGSFVIVIINCLAAIGKNRMLHYNRIVSALLDIDPNFEMLKGGHSASIRFSLRIAFLGFLRCTHPSALESRERLLKALRAMNPGEAIDQVIMQLDKMSKRMERVSRDIRISKDDLMKKRPVVEPNDVCVSDDMPAKRIRLNTPSFSLQPAQVASDLHDEDNENPANQISSGASLIDSNLTPAEKMITMIGALVAEGKRGAKSLELLISTIQPDLMADIVIETMKHFPQSPLDSSFRHGNIPMDSSEIGSVASPNVAVQSSGLSSQLTSTSGIGGFSITKSDPPSLNNLVVDSKRDPRRDLRRLDPRRTVEPVLQSLVQSNLENNSEMQSGFNHSPDKSVPASEFIGKVDTTPLSLPPKELEFSESSVDPSVDQLTTNKSLEVPEATIEAEESVDVNNFPDLILSPVHHVAEELTTSNQSDITANEDADSDMLEPDQYSLFFSTKSVNEDICQDLPALPPYVDMTDEQKITLCKLSVTRIIENHKQIRAIGSGQARLPLLGRLVAQTYTDDGIIMLLQKHIILDYHHQKGHDLAMYVLYYLHSTMITELDEPSSFAASNYEKFLLAVAKALLDSLPAADKSFSKLLSEAPFLPDPALRLLDDLCHSHAYDDNGKCICDGDRVTQGLGAIWTLILGRPLNRETCLDIALKCCVDSLDEVRTKAIRLVANKLYLLSYASETIERYASSMFLSVVDQQEVEHKMEDSSEQRTVIGIQETSISGSQNSEPGASLREPAKGTQAFSEGVFALSMSQAQQKMSLYFALCTKKPSLLKIVFDNYGRAPKAVKQSIHRHVPIVVRTIESSYTELLHIISDPPEGSEKLIVLVLQIMTEESTPTEELIAAVKRLYETKLKDAAILIPMLSSLSKDEVLPIFPRLVDLPLEKFLAALARILQGSAHTGPALTPVEVLVAIHDIDPEKDRVALKKITEACTACFEQRTVFTQHVLTKSLTHMVEKVPLPMLFMRTVIQAIDAFPTLVDFVMGILSKLVNKQIWKMPKLWVGFLKCASQTQPHSFQVFLQLPAPQLENALSRYSNLRGPLTEFANQPNTRSSLSRPTLRVLGLLNEPQQPQRQYRSSALHASSDASSSVHGSAFT